MGNLVCGSRTAAAAAEAVARPGELAEAQVEGPRVVYDVDLLIEEQFAEIAGEAADGVDCDAVPVEADDQVRRRLAGWELARACKRRRRATMTSAREREVEKLVRHHPSLVRDGAERAPSATHRTNSGGNRATGAGASVRRAAAVPRRRLAAIKKKRAEKAAREEAKHAAALEEVARRRAAREAADKVKAERASANLKAAADEHYAAMHRERLRAAAAGKSFRPGRVSQRFGAWRRYRAARVPLERQHAVAAAGSEAAGASTSSVVVHACGKRVVVAEDDSVEVLLDALDSIVGRDAFVTVGGWKPLSRTVSRARVRDLGLSARAEPYFARVSGRLRGGSDRAESTHAAAPAPTNASLMVTDETDVSDWMYHFDYKKPDSTNHESEVDNEVNSKMTFKDLIDLISSDDECGPIQSVYYWKANRTRFMVLVVNGENATPLSKLGENPTVWFVGKPRSYFRRNLVMNARNDFKPVNLVSGDNQRLRQPQSEALQKMDKVLNTRGGHEVSTAGHRTFLAILPTGCGKTAVIGLAPHVLGKARVLIVLSSTVLAEQLNQEMKALWAAQHQGLPNMETDIADVRENTTVVITHWQNITKKGGTDFLAVFKPDFLIMDEGHHSVADKLQHIRDIAFEKEPSCKLLLLTATPLRTDGTYYRLPSEAHFYLFKRQEAVLRNYIKNTEFTPITKGLDSANGKEVDEQWMRAMLKPAYDKLIELRQRYGGEPLRMLVHVNNNATATKVVKFADKLCSEVYGSRNFVNAEIYGDLAPRTRKSLLRRFKAANDEASGSASGKIDVMVQCRLLGEGYDNPYVTLSVFVQKRCSVLALAQAHGRAVRLPPPSVRSFGDGRAALSAHMFYPSGEEHAGKFAMDDVVAAYKAHEDENTDRLMLPPPVSLQKHHQKLNKLNHIHVSKHMANTDNFDAYHNAYSTRREEWDRVPADEIAVYVHRLYLTEHEGPRCVRIVDFGCGRDLCFEETLLRLCASIQLKEGVEVRMWPIDAGPISTEPQSRFSNIVGSMPSGFTLEHPLMCDFTTLAVDDLPKMDHAIFSLSLMGTPVTMRKMLALAVIMLDPAGSILIAESEERFGAKKYSGSPKENFKHWTTALDNAGFTVRIVSGPESASTPKMYIVELKPPSKPHDVSNEEWPSVLEKCLSNLEWKSVHRAKKRSAAAATSSFARASEPPATFPSDEGGSVGGVGDSAMAGAGVAGGRKKYRQAPADSQ